MVSVVVFVLTSAPSSRLVFSSLHLSMLPDLVVCWATKTRRTWTRSFGASSRASRPSSTKWGVSSRFFPLFAFLIHWEKVTECGNAYTGGRSQAAEWSRRRVARMSYVPSCSIPPWGSEGEPTLVLARYLPGELRGSLGLVVNGLEGFTQSGSSY